MPPQHQWFGFHISDFLVCHEDVEPALEAKPNIMRISCLIDLSWFTSNVIRTWRQTTRPIFPADFPCWRKTLANCVWVWNDLRYVVLQPFQLHVNKRTDKQLINAFILSTAFTSVMKMAFFHMLGNGWIPLRAAILNNTRDVLGLMLMAADTYACAWTCSVKRYHLA